MAGRTKTSGTLVLVDAGTVAGYRRSKPSLAQLHQALVHLHLQHPEVRTAVLADPSLKWELGGEEQTSFEGDIVAGAVVCAPAGALEGTAGFLSRAATRARREGFEVVAVTDRALPEVALGRVRVDGGRWMWDLDLTRSDQAGAKAPTSARRGSRPRRAAAS